MYKQNTSSNECSDQISADSDGLIGSDGITDRDPSRGDINFLSTPHLPSPFLHHFFLDPRLWGLIRILQGWPSIWEDTGWQLTGLSLVTHTGKARLTFVGQSCLHCRGPRHHYAIGLEPYTGLLNIQSFILRPFSRFYPMNSALEVIVQNHAMSVLLIVRFFGGNVSNLEWSWASRPSPFESSIR
ncbi:hypothetical protein DFH07DRAFT_801241 [Mycena maculata]|uniref:Uncharacterized protein n=1 Tax=Mycena maculata TaxID=230809 RepID=A0AAD7JX47_9AGAR|nr:hypothetical protein DFH07DRAFT_801241 [Mycena maculata]